MSFNMKRSKIQYSIEDHPVTKKDFLNHQNKEMKTKYVQQKYLLENKMFSLGQIGIYEKNGVLSYVRYRGGKYFKKDDVLALLKGN